MKNRLQAILAAGILAAVLGASAFAEQGAMAVPGVVPGSADSTKLGSTSPFPEGDRQDGRFIPKLRWISPHGELPGTYADYLQQHPLEPARFSNDRTMAPPPRAPDPRGRGLSNISILLDSDLYPSIEPIINDYATDLTAEGYAVLIETVSGGTPEDIKAWVQNRYASGSEGIIFVGDVTAAWAEVSESVFPCDLFYMDLDGHWEDADQDGDYEIHAAGNGDEGPEVFVARINAHTLDYDTEANMVNAYLAKAHAYREGTLTQPWRGLEYVDEDWFSMDVNLDQVYGDDVVRYDHGYFTTAADYLDQMDLGQHFVQVCAHSYSGGHHFGTRPTESAAYAHVYVHSPSTRSAKLLAGSDDGIKIWLNGDNVLTQDVYQGWQPDQFVTDVTLIEGWNRLLCKVSQGGGAYGFSARLTDLALATFPDLTYRIDHPDTHDPQAEFIRGWLLNGFHQDISDNFWDYLTTNYLHTDESAINPSAGQSMGGMTWTEYSSGSGFVDLNAYGGDVDFGASYAFARVYSDADASCQLWLGYDDGARVWLNGQEVLYDNRSGGFALDMTKVDVDLIAGENRLLVKVSEWMGTHGFSARLCHSDGTPMDGLTYDPEAAPISFISDWLLNGPYVNPDQASRLTQDYLGGETTAAPSEGDPAPFGSWERGMASGQPFDLGGFYDRDGGWVYSQDIQDRDPPVLFYNLFACGPGRFTDDNYLAGAYVFNTTYGLITVASAKSGSMLNFIDFTTPLGEGKTVGKAYLEWFDAQSPFELWEREWYYGMVLNGDPTLRPVKSGDMDRDGDVDLDDFSEFVQCFTGPGGGPIGSGCTPGDSDADGDIDCDDWNRFALAWTAPGDPPDLAACTIAAPLPAPAPHDVRKNRYISFDPNHTEPVAFHVELTASAYFPDSTGALGWVGQPTDKDVSQIIGEAYYSDDWPAVVHVGDCPIVPAATYEIRMTNGVALSGPLEVATIAPPTPPPPRWWADVVGARVEAGWSSPDGFVNMDDIQAAIQTFEETPGAPHWTRIDLEDEVPNAVINMTDIQLVILAFESAPYPFRAPADCP